MYNKIFTKILDSSIWMEPLPTRIVWLTFIAAMDEHGFVSFASPSNVAHRAIVPLEDTLVALAALEGPDSNSSDPENEGRRLERVPGGWIVLNAHKYRALVTKAIIQDQVRDRVRAFRAKKCNAPVTPCNAPVTQENKCNVLVTPSGAVSGAVSGAENTKYTLAQPTVERVHVEPDLFPEFWSLYDKAKGKERAAKKWASLSMQVRRKIMEALPAYVQSTPDKQFRKDPTTWLNQRCWEDEIIERSGTQAAPSGYDEDPPTTPDLAWALQVTAGLRGQDGQAK